MLLLHYNLIAKIKNAILKINTIPKEFITLSYISLNDALIHNILWSHLECHIFDNHEIEKFHLHKNFEVTFVIMNMNSFRSSKNNTWYSQES